MQAEFRIRFDDDWATPEELDEVESIVVEQAMDMAWEARLRLPICLDEHGRWTGRAAERVRALERVRIALRPSGGDWTPLIDGPVVGRDTERSSAPGESVVTLIVHDDSAFLNRRAEIESFDDRSDSEIATAIYETADAIRATNVEETESPEEGRVPREIVRRGTQIQVLRGLAERNGLHAYVLPGESPGESIGVFAGLPDRVDGLPPLVLLGDDRNVDRFHTRYDGTGPTELVGSALSIEDKSVVTYRSRVRDQRLIGDTAPFEDDDEPPNEVVASGPDGQLGLRERLDRLARQRGLAFLASGSTRPGCYAGVLEPYRLVVVRMGRTPASGRYLVNSVTHRLTRSQYRQEFTLRTDGESTAAEAARDLTAEGVF